MFIYLPIVDCWSGHRHLDVLSVLSSQTNCTTLVGRQPRPITRRNLPSPIATTVPTRRSGTTPVNLEPTTPNGFDNAYFTNLQNNRGLLSSDQILYPSDIVDRFAGIFVQSMINMGNLSPLTGTAGEIRPACTIVNSAQVLWKIKFVFFLFPSFNYHKFE